MGWERMGMGNEGVVVEAGLTSVGAADVYSPVVGHQGARCVSGASGRAVRWVARFCSDHLSVGLWVGVLDIGYEWTVFHRMGWAVCMEGALLDYVPMIAPTVMDDRKRY